MDRRGISEIEVEAKGGNHRSDTLKQRKKIAADLAADSG
jgi:hypothetical protein